MPADRTPPSPKAKKVQVKIKAEPGEPETTPGGLSPGAAPKPKNKRTAWTAEEERIFDEIAIGLLRKGMWAAVVADGRLKNRSASTVASHITAKFK